MYRDAAADDPVLEPAFELADLIGRCARPIDERFVAEGYADLSIAAPRLRQRPEIRSSASCNGAT